MTQNEQCQELFMQDVVRIDIMPVAALKVSVPFNVQDVSEAGVTTSNGSALTDVNLYAASLLSLNTNGDATADAEIKENVSYNAQEKREIAGVTRTHTLKIPIESAFQTVRDKEKNLHHADFHVILTTYDGARYIIYGLPNTCQFSIEEQIAQMNVQVTLQSANGLIHISE